MSWVANIILSVEVDDEPQVQVLNKWLKDDSGVGFLNLISGKNSQWGGYKNPEATVYAGALNHADISELAERVGAIAWTESQAVQLFIKDQEQSYFDVWMIRDNKMVKYIAQEDKED